MAALGSHCPLGFVQVKRAATTESIGEHPAVTSSHHLDYPTKTYSVLSSSIRS